MVSFIVLCAGNSSRMHSEENKNLLMLDKKPLFMHSVELFRQYSDDVIVVCKDEEKQEFLKYYPLVCSGGKNRSDSVYNGICQAKNEICFIHDGARCNISKEDIDKLMDELDNIPIFLGSYMENSLKDIDTMYNVDRNKYIQIYTPQVVYKADYIKAYLNKKNEYTDDVDLIYHELGKKPKMVLGRKDNIKVTTKEDYLSLVKKTDQVRIGSSWDIHKLVEGRKLILGGIEIPFEKGLLGHSDADVLLHAISEAFLGALALGDLGKFYPDNSDKTLNMDSKIILRECYERVINLGYHLINIDAMVFAERPKLKDYILKIRESIAGILNIDVALVSVKATTHERLGLVGDGKAIASSCHVLLYKGV